jgi:hypothetical protein
MSIPDSRLRDATKRLLELAALNGAVQSKLETELRSLMDALTNSRSSASASQFQERVQIDTRLQEFDPKTSPAYHMIVRRKFNVLTFNELRSMGEIMAIHAGITIDREAKRRRKVFFKWLHDNWARLEPEFERMVIDNGDAEEE